MIKNLAQYQGQYEQKHIINQTKAVKKGELKQRKLTNNKCWSHSGSKANSNSVFMLQKKQNLL